MLTTAIKANQENLKLGDVKYIISYCHYLLMKGLLIGNLCIDRHRPTEEQNQVSEQCRMMCNRISRVLDICKINDIPNLIDYYDLAYRMGSQCPPDKTFIKRHRHRVFKAWKNGDRRIEESVVFGIVSREVSSHHGKADREYLSAYLSIKEKWISTLKKYNRFPEVNAYENYQRLALMMHENLDKELGNNVGRVKHKWYEVNKIDDISTIGSHLLCSYRRFVSALFPGVFDYDAMLFLDTCILSELSTRTDLSPYDRKAFALAQEYNKQLE